MLNQTCLQFHMEMIRMLFFFAGIQGIVLALILFFSKRHHKRANKFLAVFIFLFSFNILRNHFYDYHNELVKVYPVVFTVTWGVISFFGPFLYLYVKSLTENNLGDKGLFKKHFSVPIVYLVFLFSVALMGISSEEQVDKQSILFYSYIGFQLFVVFQILLYLILCLKLIKGYHRRIRNEESNIDKLKLNWLFVFILGILIQYLFWILAFGGDLLIVEIKVPNYFINLFRSLSAIFVYWVGYYVLLKPEIFVQKKIISTKTVINSNQISELEISLYKKELVRLLEEDKIFLNASLTINELAKHLKVNSKVASQLVNIGFQKTFYELINFYRIEEVKKNLLNPNFKNYTLEAIAFSSGFKSTSTFNRLFKSYTKQTPNQYRNSNSK